MKLIIFLHNTILVKINFSLCEILFGILSYSNSEDDVFSIINLTILLGKWFQNSCKLRDKDYCYVRR